MIRLPRSFRGPLVAAAVATALALTGAWLARPRLETAFRAWLEREAAQRGLVASVEGVRVGLWPPIRLKALCVEKPGHWTVAADSVDARLRWWGSGLIGRTRVALGRVTVSGPGGLTLEAVPTRWDLAREPRGGLRAELRAPARGLTLAWTPDASRIEAQAKQLPVDGLFAFRRDGASTLEGGVVSGLVRVARNSTETTFDVDATSRHVRIAALSNDTAGGTAFGQPTDVTLLLAGSWRQEEGSLKLPRWRVIVDGAALSGSLAVADANADPSLDLSLDVERVEFARLFRTSGLFQPEAVALRANTSDGDLGAASLSAHVTGRLADPASFTVTQRLDFTPPRRVPAAIERLRGDFAHEAALPGGARKTIDVSPASPDFIALGAVPPLFVRTLLLGEDAGFFGHRGVDLSELPSAIAADWARGRAVRGASTITQQLAKNLFLSREKRLGRKLQELSLALMLEAALSKERILEIYLNVIEWGPGLYGLRPAARRYFHEEPGGLTPGQMAFLVALIPGPTKYQSSFAGGAVLPSFRPLVDDLLAKLCSLDAISDEQYQQALAEELVIAAPPQAMQ